MTKRINLISGPRNISTALMYSFANREDTEVVDEPMYAYFLKQSGDDHPARDKILMALPTDLEEVKSQLMLQTVDKNIYFIKGMAKHYIDMSYDFLLDFTNVFLIRDPAQLIFSFQKVIANPKMKDIGLKREWEIFEFLTHRGQQPLVIDSNCILANPELGLRTVCEALHIPFSTNMLQWQKGPIPQDGVWAPYWYKKVHQSTGFDRPNHSKPIITEHLQELYEESLLYYKKLNAYNVLTKPQTKDVTEIRSTQSAYKSMGEGPPVLT